MPRPKIYHTRAERREAHREKNKRHYAKNRDDILQRKRNTREADRKALELQEIAERKKRKAERERAAAVSVGAHGDEITSPIVRNVDISATDECERALEKQLHALTNQYRRYVYPGPRLFLNDLCRRMAVWQEETPAQQQSNSLCSKSPLLVSRHYVQRLHDDFYTIQDEYLYLIRARDGAEWQKKRKRLSDATSRFSLFLDMIDNIQQAVEREELRDRLIAKTLQYFTMYSDPLSYW
ncbi:hypothetical protein AAF712_015682 [Marasmius tenuissimus]|uniref:Uncharacterized protein n=1 Tax=Marasmius tenuissimus TaxID=585030 RepID=A0ABR2Z9K6_9AGAR